MYPSWAIILLIPLWQYHQGYLQPAKIYTYPHTNIHSRLIHFLIVIMKIQENWLDGRWTIKIYTQQCLQTAFPEKSSWLITFISFLMFLGVLGWWRSIIHKLINILHDGRDESSRTPGYQYSIIHCIVQIILTKKRDTNKTISITKMKYYNHLAIRMLWSKLKKSK